MRQELQLKSPTRSAIARHTGPNIFTNEVVLLEQRELGCHGRRHWKKKFSTYVDRHGHLKGFLTTYTRSGVLDQRGNEMEQLGRLSIPIEATRDRVEMPVGASTGGNNSCVQR